MVALIIFIIMLTCTVLLKKLKSNQNTSTKLVISLRLAQFSLYEHNNLTHSCIYLFIIYSFVVYGSNIRKSF